MEAESVLGRRTARVFGALALAVVVGAGLLICLDWYIEPSRPGERKDLVLTMAQILGGAALLSGLYFTWRTLQVSREGQITERFTRAIDHLGATYDDRSKNLELRLGGIYALERISRESERDHWPIMEVLTAYVRQHARWPPEEAVKVIEDASTARGSKEGTREQPKTTEGMTPAPDIQAILTVLRRRTYSYRNGEPEPLDLSATDLRGANLSGANLSEANLSGANLRGANLRNADLSVVSLTQADLKRATLAGANVWGSDISRVNLSDANLVGASLQGVSLWKANLRRAKLGGVYLYGANLKQANLSRARLSRTTNFQRADLRGARGLTDEQLSQAQGDEYTKLPGGVQRPSPWAH